MSNFKNFEEDEILGEEYKEQNSLALEKAESNDEIVNISNVRKTYSKNDRGYSRDNEMQELMKLQETILNETAGVNPNGIEDLSTENLEDLLKSYDQYAKQRQYAPGNFYTDNKNLTTEELQKIEENVSEKMANAIQNNFTKKYFHSTNNDISSDEVLGLIPAETVDQGILVNGSTVAIRTKEEIKLSSPILIIPKGAIIYGKVAMSANRLLIDVESYKQGNKLYVLDFSLYDFDGRAGVHLGNRTWPKIPANVTKDVYEYAYQKGTQAATFGGGGDINIEEAKDVAVLSTAKEVSRELFEKRRVFMPKKYHLWLNINPN